MKSRILSLVLSIVLFLTTLESCFLFPDTKPIGGNDTTKVPIPYPAFTPTLEWVKPTRSVAMDIAIDNIVLSGNTVVSGELRGILEIFTKQGERVYYDVSTSESGIARDILVDPTGGIISILVDYPITGSKNNASSYGSGYITNPYTKYNTFFAAPTAASIWQYDPEEVGPSIAKSKAYSYEFRSTVYTLYSSWIVGSFADMFQPRYFGEGKNFACPTFGKADCFVIRAGSGGLPVRHQWGGVENDLAYDVASDTVTGHATIFLRAGTPFPITSATRTLVNVQTGYNIIRLDTNGLLTETFPVTLEATGELTDTQIALGVSGAVYILAKDEAKKQYFLAKVSRSGTAWIRYFPTSVADKNNTFPRNRSPRMGLVVDSKDCVYITGNFSGTVDWGGVSLSGGSEAVVVKYSPTNTCLGALALGTGFGVTIRLSPQEDAVYINGWADGSIMGVPIPNYDDPRNGVLRPGAFLLKLKL